MTTPAPAVLHHDTYRWYWNGYEPLLRWGDEFDACAGNAPDASKWEHELGFVRNGEQQYYIPSKSRCSDGALQIDASYDPKDEHTVVNPLYTAVCAGKTSKWCEKRRSPYIPVEYTSDSLLSKADANLGMGQYDARIRITWKSGSWPAWWFMGLDANWPWSGEVDVMELYEGNMHFNV